MNNLLNNQILNDTIQNGDEWKGISLLKAWGYAVGSQSPSALERRFLLIMAFRQDVPVAKLPADYGDCGANNSPERLKKIDDILSSMCRDFEGKIAGDAQLALEHCESDLDWLRQEVYFPMGFDFSWP